MQQFWVGVDGGASKCRIQVQNSEGKVIGVAVAGPANIRLSVEQSWKSIQEGIQTVFNQAALTYDPLACHLGVGVAGCEIQSAYDAFLKNADGFASLCVVSDAHAACLGAHAGRDGAIVIVGTGMVGFQQEKEQLTFVSGGGFPHDDQGSGAGLGLAAISHTLKVMDLRSSSSKLSDAVAAHFHNDRFAMLAWADHANATDYAKFAPMVVAQALEGDAIALKLMQFAASEVYLVVLALKKRQQEVLPISICGGLAESIYHYLPNDLQQELVEPVTTPEVGMIHFIKKN